MPVIYPDEPILPMPDMNPFHPNPIRRFREALRMNRKEFSALVKIPMFTLKTNEAEFNPSTPGAGAMRRLLRVAKRNNFPLTESAIVTYCAQFKARRARRR